MINSVYRGRKYECSGTSEQESEYKSNLQPITVPSSQLRGYVGNVDQNPYNHQSQRE